MARKRWKDVSESLLRSVVATSLTKAEVLAKLGMRANGGHYITLKSRIDTLNIDTAHFCQPNPPKRALRPLAAVLVKDSNYGRGNLKKRLLAEGILENKCSTCGQLPWWCDQPLVIALDHINGDARDNRIENLRMLCPHCHTQTPTFSRRNDRLPENRCPDCDKQIARRSVRCQPCANRRGGARRAARIQWPSDAQLLEMVEQTNVSQVARKLGLSHNTVKGRIKKIAPR